jgi:uncharacterized protein YqiB (DUF1249 family)
LQVDYVILSDTLCKHQGSRKPSLQAGGATRNSLILAGKALQRAKKQAFKLDLAELHAVCEANYARLMRLFPDYENSNSREFAVADARIWFEVVERCRYTTIFRLHQQQSHDRWLGRLLVEVRAYHDAGMLEVGTFQSHGRIAARYQYPNNRMYQQDEKSQQNRFLADWLEHCLQHGRAAPDSGLTAGLS